MAKELAILGCGSMGTAILSGILTSSSSKKPPITSFSAIVRTEKSALKLRAKFIPYLDRLKVSLRNSVAAAQEADVVLIATKPYALREVLRAPGMADAVRGKLVISVMAGIPPAQIMETLYGESGATVSPCYVVHATLNLATRVRQCITVLDQTSLDLPEAYLHITLWLFEQIGEVRYLPSHLMPAAATLAAIPALMSLALDGILDGAVASGVVRSQAREIAAFNLMGLAKLLLDGDTPEQLREDTSSPRGVTIQALLELERGRVRSTYADAFLKASQHAETMNSIQD